MEVQTSPPDNEAKSSGAGTPRPGKSRRGWKLVAWGALTVALILAASAGLWHLKYNKYRFHDSHYGIEVTDKRTEDQADQARARALGRVKRLRDAWQPWAMQHRELLQRMLAAKPDDYRVLDEVYEALPINPPANGLLDDVTPSEQGGVDLSWQPLGKLKTASAIDRVYSNPQDRARQRRMLTFGVDLRRRQFQKHHNVLLSNTISVGIAHLSLWASGRVTETQFIRRYVPGKPVSVAGPDNRFLPSYDFLQPEKGNAK
jgi:hypothetical protein